MHAAGSITMIPSLVAAVLPIPNSSPGPNQTRSEDCQLLLSLWEYVDICAEREIN